MADTSFIAWPFFQNSHHDHFDALSVWCEAHAHELHEESGDVEADCRRLVKIPGGAGWLRAAVSAAHGGLNVKLDVRTLCLTRMTLGYHAALADFTFAMQGPGTGAISLFGNEAVKQAYLPKMATGDMISGFALSEREAGSDVAALDTRATKVSGGWIINGEKTWISNGAIADVLTFFARSGEAPGAKGLSAFVFPTATEGFSVVERIDVIALLISRAAWAKDQGQPSVTREAAMAKLYAADTAQQTIDKALHFSEVRGSSVATPPSSCTGKSAHCASTRGRARSRRSSSLVRPSPEQRDHDEDFTT